MQKISDESIEELRLILQKSQGRRFSEAEARKIGRWLLKLYVHFSSRQRTKNYSKKH